MVNGIGASDPHGLSKRRCSKFCVGSKVQQETPEEGRRTQWLKCEGKIKDENNNLKTLNDRNHQASSLKFRQLIYFSIFQFQ